MSLFYIRPIDPVGEDMPSNGTTLEIFECFEESCEHTHHFDTLEGARNEIRSFKKTRDKPISSDKVNSFKTEGYYYPVAGEYPAVDEVEHFATFLRLKCGEDADFDPSEHIEVVCLEDKIIMVFTGMTHISGNDPNPMVFDGIVKVEDVIAQGTRGDSTDEQAEE